MKKSLQRQTLPVIPARPKPLSLWNSFLLFLFGLTLGCSIGLTRAKAESDKTIYEHLTEKDRSELNALIGNLTNKGENL